jgi:hypothetical protein
MRIEHFGVNQLEISDIFGEKLSYLVLIGS